MTTENSHHSLPSESQKWARNLEAVLRVSQTIASSLDLSHTLKATCQAAVELLGVDHSTLVMLNSDRKEGRVCAEYPEIGVRGLVLRIAEIGGRTGLGESTDPTFIPDVNNASHLGAIREVLASFDIRSILIVPVLREEEILGYFTLNSVARTQAHRPQEIELCRIFAAQVAVAIKNAQLYEETKHRAEQLEVLRRTSLAMTSELELDTLLQEIIQKAQGLLKAKNGGIFEYHPQPQELMVIVDSSPGGRKKGVTLREGEGMAGRLVRSEEPYMIVDNYEEWSGRAPVDSGRRPSGAVLEVKITWQGQLIGSLYVEDDVPRKFTKEDAQLLLLFADQAGIAMNNAKLVKALKEEHENLASLDWAAQSLSGLVKPEQVLQRSAEQAQKAMNADSASIWPYDKNTDTFLTSDLVTAGISGAELEEFRNQPPPAKGISRAILSAGWLAIEDLLTADDEFIRQTPRTELLLRIGIKSFQGIALKVGHEAVGVLYVNYNRARRFHDDDRQQLEWQATTATLALVIARNAQLTLERAEKLRVQGMLAKLSHEFLSTLQRQQILDRTVRATRELLTVDRCTIDLPDNKGSLLVAAEDGLEEFLTGNVEVQRSRHSQTIRESGNSIRVRDYESEFSFSQAKLISAQGLKSGMSAPMFSGSKPIGAISVYSRERRDFTKAEEETLTLIANLVTSALERLDDITRKEAYLSALYEATKAIDEESGKAIKRRKFDSERIFQEIVKQAVMCLVDSHGPKASIGTLRFYDQNTQELSLESVYSLENGSTATDSLKKKRRIVGVPLNMVGYAGLTVLRGEPLLIPNVREGELKDYYYEFVKSTRSELAVPMRSQNKVIGVLNVESNRIGAFDETDQQVLQSLADFAVIPINNAAQYRELRKTDRLVDARTKIAFMGMASSIWGHSIRGATISIRELVRIIRLELKRSLLIRRKRISLAENLERIDKLASMILERPVIEPLGSDRGVETLPIRRLVQERVMQMRWPDPFGTLNIKLDVDIGEISVRCHPQWLRRALDIVLDNAAKALLKVDPARRSLKISTSLLGDKVEIAISDTGPGIPPELREVVLNGPVLTSTGEGGSGIGLLMAQTIINAYGGEIEVSATSESGTTIVISLPVEESLGTQEKPVQVATHPTA